MYVPRSQALEYLRQIMSGHKAMGLVAQHEFEKWVMEAGDQVRGKLFPGCWVISPRENFYSRRTCFFVHQQLIDTDSLSDSVSSLVGNRGFQSMCSSLWSAGFSVLYFIAHLSGPNPGINAIQWKGYRYRSERLEEMDLDRFFRAWGGRGRPSRGRPWETAASTAMEALNEEELTSILLGQLFYNNLLKTSYRISTMDPYDVDGFIISYDGKVFPVEIKEKFPFSGSMGMTVGIDAGRVLMMLRIAIPTDGNAFYVVREVEHSDARNLVGWKIMTLDRIVMRCSWNLQGGGPGMASSAGGAGSATSTILLPYNEFANMGPEAFSEDSLRGISKLSDTVKRQAREFLLDLERMFD